MALLDHLPIAAVDAFSIVPTRAAAKLGESGGHLDVSEVIAALVGRPRPARA